MQLTRGEFLRLAVAAACGWSGTAAVAASSAPIAADRAAGSPSLIGAADRANQAPVRSDRDSRIAEVIDAYDRQGIHRTATDTDGASATWLADRARQAGGAPALEAFPIDRVDVRAAYVQSDGHRLEGLPFFDGTFTDARGVHGRIGPPESGQPLALVTLNAGDISSEGQSLADLRRSGRFLGIVAVTSGAEAGLSPSNAALFARPYGTPVLQVSSEDAVWLQDSVRLQRDVEFVAYAVRTPATATNVVATIAGREGNLAPVVVMTPRSGWWHCASERGGGLACWLEIMRTAAANPTRRPLVFVASSGHELGHFGLDRFIERREGLIRSAAAWVHLGANIGAAGGAARIQTSDDAIEGVARAALVRAGADVRQFAARGTVPGGEARNIHVGGGRYVSLLGSNALFHNPADRWPAAVDVGAVSRFAAAFADVTAALSAS